MIDYTWSVTTAPAAEVLSTADAKLHLGIGAGETQWDTYISGLITAARKFVERRTNRAMINQTVTMYLSVFPETITLPIAPAFSVTSVKYYDTGGTLQTLSASLYQSDLKSAPARIRPSYGNTWPTTRSMMNAVEVVFVAGYGAAGSDVPADLLAAVKLLLAHWFENREAVDTVAGPVAISFEALVRSYRVRLPAME